MNHSAEEPSELHNDELAFADAFNAHRPRLRQMLKFRMDPRLQARADLSDVLQETYLEAYRRREHFHKQCGMSFYVWIRHLTIQRLIDLHRRHLVAGKRSVRHEVSVSRTHYNPVTSGVIARHFIDQMMTPSQVVIRRELIDQLAVSLEELEPLDREILALRHFEEMRNSEIAETLGISDAAASNRYVRALTRLRKSLKQFPDFNDAP